MNPLAKHTLALALAAAAAFAQAQTPPTPAASGPGAGGHGPGMMHHRWDPAKMEQRRAEHLAQLKQKLRLTPAQEPAWNAFAAAMPKPMQRPDRAEMDKLNTPERLDRMKAMRDARAADMDRMSAAAKTFYAQLTPEQKKAFDEQGMPRHGGMMRHGH